MDDHPNEETVTAGTVEDYARHWGKACPECGTNEWAPFISLPPDSPPEDNALWLMAVRSAVPDTTLKGYIETFAVACTNCGYLKQYLGRKVIEWAEKNGRT